MFQAIAAILITLVTKQTNYMWDAELLTCCLHDGNLVKCMTNF